MFEAKQTKVLVMEIDNEVGAMYKISKIVSEKGVNIIGATGEIRNTKAVIRLLTDDNLRAKDELLEKGYDPIETAAVTVELPHKPGILKTVTEKLADANIDILHLAATALIRQDECLLLLETNDIEGTVVALNRA